MRWEGLEPSRLAAHGPQPCLSANSSTSAYIQPKYRQNKQKGCIYVIPKKENPRMSTWFG